MNPNLFLSNRCQGKEQVRAVENGRDFEVHVIGLNGENGELWTLHSTKLACAGQYLHMPGRDRDLTIIR